MIWHYCKLCCVPSVYFICNTCLNKLAQLPDLACRICLKPLSNDKSLCPNCSFQAIYFNKIYCQFIYTEPLSKMLTEFKYHKQKKNAWLLSYLLYLKLSTIDTPDIIVPIPLHKQRYKERGFNQVDKLLDFYRSQTNTNTINTKLITRTKNTNPQTLMNYTERKNNIVNAFKLHDYVENKTILLIDDVVTTTSTINEVAKLLKQNGAKRVDVCCLMRAS